MIKHLDSKISTIITLTLCFIANNLNEFSTINTDIGILYLFARMHFNGYSFISNKITS